MAKQHADIKQNSNLQAKIQKFGSYLSGMVMPNLAAFIAWGILTALFIPTGWLPNETLGKLVAPTIKYLLPLLIGYTGGYNIYGQRGGSVGAIAAMGVVISAEIPMFLGAMITGPLGGWLIKKVDKQVEGRVKAGFEMLINNFSAGIVGGILMCLSFLIIGPAFAVVNTVIVAGVKTLIEANLLPLASIIVAPAQVLFLNNAVNHGILVPLAVQQAAVDGQSILFLVEGNTAPLVGVLLAYCLFGKGAAKQTAPGASIIVLFGGIAEVYFPYILMKPALIIAPILGSMCALFTFGLLGGGLVAPPSPGSIFAFLAMTPKGHFAANLAGFTVGITVSFLVASLILKSSKATEEDDVDSLIKATDKMEELKGKESAMRSVITGQLKSTNIKKIVFACDAGMGSSAMGASILNDKLKKADINITVINRAINNIPEDADLMITHKDLAERAKMKLPGVRHISVDNFLNSPEYDKLVEELKS